MIRAYGVKCPTTTKQEVKVRARTGATDLTINSMVDLRRLSTTSRFSSPGTPKSRSTPSVSMAARRRSDLIFLIPTDDRLMQAREADPRHRFRGISRRRLALQQHPPARLSDLASLLCFSPTTLSFLGACSHTYSVQRGIQSRL
jgi:hypothetical protein